jgi:hypothetical protein
MITAFGAAGVAREDISNENAAEFRGTGTFNGAGGAGFRVSV